MYKDKAPELGDKGRITNHQHELVFSNNSMKPGYGKSGWICDICRKSFHYNTPNFFVLYVALMFVMYVMININANYIIKTIHYFFE